jgi:hypothetical protein
MKIDKDKFPLEIDGDYISNLQVMKSAAGHYIGRSYFDSEIGAELPYSRESGYYATHDEAQRELDGDTFEVRDCIENAWAYRNGLPLPR